MSEEQYGSEDGTDAAEQQTPVPSRASLDAFAELSPEGHAQFGRILDPLVLRYAVLGYLVVI